MEIKVIGAGCEHCTQLYENVKQAVAELGMEASITKVEDLVEIVTLGVMSAPSVMIDGTLVVSGQVASVKKLKSILSK
ncbi:MAG: thioredoxin family protein [Lachnospiraceae bacterium]